MTNAARPSGRSDNQLRPVEFELNATRYAEGSVIANCGNTRVLCTATIDTRVPPFVDGVTQGWLTAEYGMLPRSTHTRMRREATQGKQSGRTLEIQRLIGRSLRAGVDMGAFPGFTVTIDCDVLQADGGTRTTSISGGYVALAQALGKLKQKGHLMRDPLHGQVAAVSVGIFAGRPVLDLDYDEDSSAETDMNIVMNDAGAYIEIQGTAEGHAFRREELNGLLALADKGIKEIMLEQTKALANG